MALVCFTLEVTPPVPDGLSDANIEARAAADPDNPPMTAEELD
jgi:hypothetical protein